MEIEINPSAEARQIFNMMVVRAESSPPDNDLHLSLSRTIELSAVLQRQGGDAMASTAVAELREADWIVPASDGGWQLA